MLQPALLLDEFGLFNGKFGMVARVSFVGNEIYQPGDIDGNTNVNVNMRAEVAQVPTTAQT